ncbi:uncharacterized protein LOC120846971 [Ixodes scapularis]|uniref:uncharacterized protein LOC120846971 n=1 Tax=Ixodes scapularis TaxID=6945 RepID=UPI001A9E37BF|nr:uncharacterized protein LOC120846971 [Ixodes scapularis]
MLRDQFVRGLNDVAMQTRLLETAELDFETARNTVIAMEAAKKDSRALRSQLAQATPVQAGESANVVKTKPTKQQASGSCFRCGGNHLAHKCHHVGSVCFKCEQRGRLARVCRSNACQTEKAGPRSESRPVHNVDDELAAPESKSGTQEAYDLWALQAAGPEPMRVEVAVNGVTLNMELDTGASVSTISERKFTELFPSATLEPSDVHLRVLCGDVELNPGPLSAAQENQLVEAMQLIPSMHEGQKTVINELKAIKDLQTTFERKLEGLFSRIAIIESDVAAIKPLRGEFEELKASNRELDTQLRTTALRQEELENQSRRNNLLIYGLPDVAAETWEASEAKALSFFADKLDIHLEATSIERAHRIGRFAADKNRPLISKFLSFKDKQRVLSKAFKLKRSGFSISDDFSPAVQFARRRLLDYASEQNAQFKLRYNKLTIGNKTYMYDPNNDTVFESAR